MCNTLFSVRVRPLHVTMRRDENFDNKACEDVQLLKVVYDEVDISEENISIAIL